MLIEEHDNVTTITIPNAKHGDFVRCTANNNIGCDKETTIITIPRGNYRKTIFAVYKATINIILVSHP